MLGENLKAARLGNGYTQQELADKVQEHRVNIAKYESGTGVPSVAVLIRLADALNVSLDWLFDREGNGK
jgi:transcriptional regulator with XRE-family HTH domain